MKKTLKTFLFIGASTLMLRASAESLTPITWPAQKSAVAWQTKKRLLLVRTLEPFGINTDIKIKIVKGDNKRIINLEIPVAKFNSEEPSRDEEVIKILKAEVQPNMEFNSNPISEDIWKKLTGHEAQTIDGNLKIGGVNFPVHFSVRVTGTDANEIIEGESASTFTYFGIKPPIVGGGLIAKVRDELYLFIHIYRKDIEGL